MEEPLEKYFRIDPLNGESLSSQLRRCLASFIAAHPAGTFIPSERALTGMLKIARGTVRLALKEFYDRGMIVHSGHKGTVIAPAAKRESEPEGKGYQMPFFTFAPTELNVMIYETLPSQKQAWRSCVDTFNARRQSGKINIHWQPHPLSLVNISEYLKAHQIDIFQSIRFPEMHLVGRPLPSELIGQITSGDYLTELFKDSPKPYFDLMVPQKFAHMGIYWNREYAEACGIRDIPKRIAQNKFSDILLEASTRLPSDRTVCNNLWIYLFMKGCPDSRKLDRRHVRNLLSAIAGLRGKKNLFLLGTQYMEESLEMFQKKNLLFMNYCDCFFTQSQNYPFTIDGACVLPDKGSRLTIENDGMYLTPYCRDTLTAVEFLRHTLSEEVQSTLASACRMLPFHRKAAAAYIQKSALAAPAELFESWRILDCMDPFQIYYYKFLRFEIRDILERFMFENLPMEEAADMLLRRWDYFYRPANVEAKFMEGR